MLPWGCLWISALPHGSSTQRGARGWVLSVCGSRPKNGFFWGCFHPLTSMENFRKKYHVGWKSPCATEFRSGLSETLDALFFLPPAPNQMIK